MAAGAYLLDNAQAVSVRRMSALARLFDAATLRALDATGLGEGWSCLEVGGGGGSVAHWLAARVAPTGSVLCTDIDPRHIPSGPPNLRVVRHDIVRDPLPEAAFDLVHTRLVLIHVPERVEVLASREGRRVVVRVADNGSGIPAEIRERIFDPFFTTKPVGQGTGLGLDIVRRLVCHNDGEIAVESRPGRTEFRIALPIAEAGGTQGAS